MRARLFAALAVGMSCACCSPAQAQTKNELAETFLAAFRHFLAVTSAGVNECGSRFPDRKDGFTSQFERMRLAHIDVIVQAELSEQFAEFLRVEKSHAAAETDPLMAEYCADLPRQIGVVDGYASRLRLVLLDQ